MMEMHVSYFISHFGLQSYKFYSTTIQRLLFVVD